jgi:type IV pilus assembly protein PilF
MNKFIFIILSLFVAACATTDHNRELNETAELHMQIADSHYNNGNYPLALKELLIAEDLNPNNPEVQAALGRVYFARDRFDLSEKHYKKAISIKPEFTEAKNNLARVYIEFGQLKQAEVLLKDVMLDLTYVNFPKAYANYGVLQFKRKDYPSAITYFKKSLERDRENCYTLVYLGRSYLEMKDTVLGVSQLEKSIPFCNQIDSDEALYYSAIALYRNHQEDKAKLRFEELLKLYPSGYNNEKAQKMLDLIEKGAP